MVYDFSSWELEFSWHGFLFGEVAFRFCPLFASIVENNDEDSLFLLFVSNLICVGVLLHSFFLPTGKTFL